ncbi:amidase [Mycobacterium sp. MS1601]|uniref:amidase n=1 Tax=Mycobacterium sp. MS1601 TaxID=1936029 RepID=UPI0009796B86|nr:amidase family protein [Mycobacterium sp. MS1601]AQA03279.1 amidase [Mycobacterium sp. MS1601]
MPDSQLCWTPATVLADQIRSGAVSTTEVATEFADRIEAVNPALNAYIHFDREQVLADAAQLQAELDAGTPRGPLHGVPFSIKGLTTMAGLPFDSSLKPLAGTVGTHDATVVTRMKQAGGLFLGKTNAPEFGYYGGTDSHLYGPTHNPWKPGHTAGGSSGGAAASVAAGLGPLAEGADGAGSVRIPAAMCGVVGFKPSLGRIPHTLLDGRHYTHIFHGPITRTVGDAALMFSVMAGVSDSDPNSVPADGIDYASAVRGDITGWRVAWSPDLGLGYVDPEVAAVCAEAVKAFEALGAVVEEATPDWGDPEEAMWKGLWVPGYSCEYDVLDWKSLGGQVDDFLIEIFAQAETLTAVEIGRAEAFRGRMWDTFSAFMRDYDLVVSPTLASATFPLDRFAPAWLDGQSLQRRLLGWLLTYPYNMTTTPAISVPAGFTSDGRPVGLQIAGRHRADASVLRAAANYEAARPWAAVMPAL